MTAMIPSRPTSSLFLGLTLLLTATTHSAIIHITPEMPIRIPFSGFIDLDLDGDGTDDYRFTNNFQDVHVVPSSGARIIAKELFPMQVAYIAENLDAETWIGNGTSAGTLWTNQVGGLASCTNAGGVTCIGPFITPGYLGVEFQIAGETHYGWIGILPGEDFAIRMDIVDWAYETSPNTPLLAGQIPEPAAPILLAAGLLLAAGFRRRSESPSRETVFRAL